MSDWQNTKNKAIFTVSGLSISGGTTAARVHTSILYENGIGHVGEAAKDGVEAVSDTGKAIGSLGKDVGERIGSGVKDAWNSIF